MRQYRTASSPGKEGGRAFESGTQVPHNAKMGWMGSDLGAEDGGHAHILTLRVRIV
jgi:hypothetical protein